MKPCPICYKSVERSTYIYCSNKCQKTNEYRLYINKWKQGLVTGSRGIRTKNISGHLIRYLLEKFGEKCSVCSWNGRNPITRKVPLEIDHIDGDAENNLEENLRLICPNCHALSTNFRNLNKGKGRAWRMQRYKRVTS